MVLLFEASLQGTVGAQVHSSVMLWSFNLPCVQEYVFAANTYAFSSLNILPAPLVPAVVSSYFTLCTVSSSETEKKVQRNCWETEPKGTKVADIATMVNITVSFRLL